MSDFAQVILVGNLQHDIRSKTDRATGMVYGSSVLCVGTTSLVQGEPVTQTLAIPIEFHGQSRVSRVQQQFGAGSRMLCQGTLTQRDHHADGSLRVVVETVFSADTAPVGAGRRAAHGPRPAPRERPEEAVTEAEPSDGQDAVWRSIWR
jgi:single-stranded DNA-binding protein